MISKFIASAFFSVLTVIVLPFFLRSPTIDINKTASLRNAKIKVAQMKVDVQYNRFLDALARDTAR